MSATVRRVLVALDTSPGSRSALSSAARLAQRMRAELAGIFVEDIDLLNWASLPFARETSLASATSRALVGGEIERELRRQAEQAESDLSGLARRLGLSWSFRVARGRVAVELLDAALETDVLALGMIGVSPGHTRLGSTARALLSAAGCAVLLTSPGDRGDGGVTVIHDGSRAADIVFRRAVELAEGNGSLTVLLPVGGDDGRLLRTRLQQELTGTGIEPEFVAVPAGSPRALVGAILAHRPGTLVLGEMPSLDADGIRGLLRELDGNVLRVAQ